MYKYIWLIFMVLGMEIRGGGATFTEIGINEQKEVIKHKAKWFRELAELVIYYTLLNY